MNTAADSFQWPCLRRNREESESRDSRRWHYANPKQLKLVLNAMRAHRTTNTTKWPWRCWCEKVSTRWFFFLTFVCSAYRTCVDLIDFNFLNFVFSFNSAYDRFIYSWKIASADLELFLSQLWPYQLMYIYQSIEVSRNTGCQAENGQYLLIKRWTTGVILWSE